MTFYDELQICADSLFDLAGETVTYTGANSFPVPMLAIVRDIGIDEAVDMNVRADSVIFQVKVSDFASMENESPQRGDTLQRTSPFYTTDIYEVIPYKKLVSGIYEIIGQRNIRITP